MVKRGDKKRFKEFVSCIKQNPHRYLYIKNTLNKLKAEDVDINTQSYGGKTLLHIALKLNNLRLFNLFLSAGVNPNLANEDSETPLHRSVIENKLEFVKSLVNFGCDLNIGAEQEQTPLHLAAINGNLEIAKYLVENGADIMIMDEINNLPIDYAIDEKDADMIGFILSKHSIDGERKKKINEILRKEGETRGVV